MPRPDLTIQLAPDHPDGLILRNPVMWASGTFGWDGYGGGLPAGMDFQQLGAVVAKTTTLAPRAGNPTPRVVHGQGWLLNSIGLQNPGIDHVLREEAPRWAKWRVPVLLSIAGEASGEYEALAARADGVPGIAALELNISCPNVEGGLEFGQSPELTDEVTRRVRSVTSLPVVVKLSPNVSDIVAVARAAAQAGAHAMSLTNTLVGMAMDGPNMAPALGATTGGVSGSALKPVALAAVYRVFQAVELPLIGVGGVQSAQDALDYLAAGATAVQVGTASLANPWALLDVLRGLESALARHDGVTLTELVGRAHGPHRAKARASPSA